MNEKQLSLDTRQVCILGNRQRVYVRDCTPIMQKHIPQQKIEVVTERVELPTGYYEKLVEREYPITSESVSSYADTADFRNDPLGAIASAPKRVNLGDITGVQEFANGDPQKAISTYREVLGKISNYLVQLSQQQPVPAKEPNKGEETK